MRKILLMLIFAPLFMSAQIRFGYYYHSEVLNAIPGYRKAVGEYELLKQRCDAEIERNEKELTRYYVAYLDGQQDFPEPILRKRQKELQQLVDNSVLLRDQLKQWLAEAKDSLFAPYENKVNDAVKAVCVKGNLAYAINAEEVAYRYINPNAGVNITQSVINKVTPSKAKPVPVVTECDEKSDEAIEKAVEDVLKEEENMHSAVEAESNVTEQTTESHE